MVSHNVCDECQKHLSREGNYNGRIDMFHAEALVKEESANVAVLVFLV